MKIITIVTLATLFIGAAEAEYMIHIPLGQAQDGHLPIGSIRTGQTAQLVIGGQ